MAVTLLAEPMQDQGPEPVGRNARHMVVIKTGAAEHSVYISMLPMGLRSFMSAVPVTMLSLSWSELAQAEMEVKIPHT